MKFTIRNTVILLGLICITPAVYAQGSPDAVISYRKNVMKAVGGHTGALFTIAKGNLTEYQDQMLYHARALQEAALSIPAMYPEGTGEGKTRAKAEIWSEREAFEAVAGDMAKAAEKLVKIVEAGNLSESFQALRPLGKSCKDCHNQFRKKR